jgi:glycogen(starch) synthase
VRVLMSADAVGGVFTFALELAGALGARGAHVALALMGAPPANDQRAAAEALPGVELHCAPYALEWMEEPWRDVAAAGEWLLALAAHARADLVHLNGYAHASLPFERPVVVGAHSCVLSWFHAVRGSAPPPEWRRYAAAVRRGLASANAIVAPSRAMARELARHYAPPTRVRVIHNGRTPSAFAPRAKQPFVLAAGRAWDEAKNLRALAAIAPALRWPVRIAGEGSRELAGVCGLGRVSASELASHYGNAGVYALPARYEPFGLSALEAALSGCALVLGDIPSLRELWGGAAAFVPPEDGAALARALNALADDDALRERMAARARARARRFSAARMADGWTRLYATLLGSRAEIAGAAPHRAELEAPCAS